MENTGFLDMTELTKIAVSFHCDTCNTFLTNSHQATVVTDVKNGKLAIGKDLEQF